MKPLTAEDIAELRKLWAAPTGVWNALDAMACLACVVPMVPHLLAAYELLAKLGAEALTEDANIHAILIDLAEWAEKEGVHKADYSR